MGPGDLQEILADLPLETDPNLLVGRETSDDAGVYKLRDDLALIQTLDFFTPIVNDPYLFGQIAAVNALSDVYAMGGKPLTAMNIVCFPKKTLDKSVLKEILKGGLEKIHEAGALLVGGHSVDDVELKYGLSVTGIIHPDKVMTNAGARPGDQLILTKPIGTGIIATALKGKAASPEAEEAMIRVMVESNRIGAEVMQEVGAHVCTDITGFGLLGHALEMAIASQCCDDALCLPGPHHSLGPGIFSNGYGPRRHPCQSKFLPSLPAGRSGPTRLSARHPVRCPDFRGFADSRPLESGPGSVGKIETKGG